MHWCASQSCSFVHCLPSNPGLKWKLLGCRVIVGLYIGIMEKKMETTIVYWDCTQG